MKLLKILLCVLTALSILAFVGTEYYVRVYMDTTPPTISMAEDIISVSAKEDQSVALMQGISASDDRDGDLSGEVMIGNVSRLIGANTAKVNYIVFDSSDNMATASRTVCYTDYRAPRFTLVEPLAYGVGETVALAERVKATDAVEGDITDKIRLVGLSINNNVEGIYHVSLRVTNEMGDSNTVTLPVIIRNVMPQSPEIVLSENLIYMTVGGEFAPEDYFVELHKGVKNARGTYSDLTVKNAVDPDTVGTYEVHYSYTNTSGYSADAVLTVVVEESEVVA